MKQPHEMTTKEINQVFSALMDSSVQQELMEGNHPDEWMLDYVYDSQLRKSLEDYQHKIEKANLLKDLLKTNMDNKQIGNSKI